MTLSSGRGQTPPVRLLCSSSPNSVCRQKTSPGCRAILVHRLFVFRYLPFSSQSYRENKKPCLHAVSRVKKFSFDSLPAYTVSVQITFGPLPNRRQGQSKAKHIAPGVPAMTCRFRDRSSSANSWLICLSKSSSNVETYSTCHWLHARNILQILQIFCGRGGPFLNSHIRIG